MQWREKNRKNWKESEETHTHIRIYVWRAIEDSTMPFKKVAFTASCKLVCDLFGKHAQLLVTDLSRPFPLQQTRTERTEPPNAFKWFYFLASCHWRTGDTLNDLNFDVSSFYFFFWATTTTTTVTIAHCLKGPSNGLQITSSLAFAKRPYAKIENAKTMEKRGNSFSSEFFWVKKPLHCFSRDRFFLVVVVVVIQNCVYCTQYGSISCL